MPSAHSIVAICVDGFILGAFAFIFGMVAVRFWRIRDPRLQATRLSIVAGALSLSCALLVVIWFMEYPNAPRVALTLSVPFGFALTVLGRYLIRRCQRKQAGDHHQHQH